MPAKNQTKHLAILGGGVSALSTAFHLTQLPNWDSRYTITVYQLGWRLGGKAATGRDRTHADRIEDHGIHAFMRNYFNTWQVMKVVYSDDNGVPDDAFPAGRSIPATFIPDNFGLAADDSASGWQTYGRALDGVTEGVHPWTGPAAPTSPAEAAFRTQSRVYERLRELLDAQTSVGTIPEALAAPLRELRAILEPLDANPEELNRNVDEIIASLRNNEGLWAQLFEHANTLRTASGSGAYGILVDLYEIVMRRFVMLGFAEVVQQHGGEIDALDAFDYRDWLLARGFPEVLTRLRDFFVVPNTLFSFPDGDSTRPPRLSAATWLAWLLRAAVGQGAPYYFVAGGTGDAVVQPLYHYLRAKGVRFEFFHRLTAVRANEGTIDALEFDVQARTQNNAAYEPLIAVRDRTGRRVTAWPNAPLWEQLVVEPGVRADFESWPSELDPPPASIRTLQRGKDFDFAVWAMPPTMFARVAQRAFTPAQSSYWASLFNGLPTTATQAAQLWLKEPTTALGWTLPPQAVPGSRYICAALPGPQYAVCAFDDILDHEGWPADAGPRGLIYFCGQVEPTGASNAENVARAHEAIAATLRQFGYFMPAAIDPKAGETLCFDFSKLYVRPEHEFWQGLRRLRDQYFRANTDPTNVYVQAPAGTAKARPLNWETGFANLVFAGDWTYTGINAGCFEGAISSGKLAALALASPSWGTADVIAFDFLHASAAKRIEDAFARGDLPLDKSQSNAEQNNRTS